MIQRLVFSGTGGQGVITAAVILAEAAIYGEGLNAVQTQVYGPEARGGSARSDVIIADSEIWFPKVLEPNVLICLSQQAYSKYSELVRPGGVVIVDSHSVKRWTNAHSREIELPLHETIVAINGGDERATQGINICLLGALSRLSPVVSFDSIRAAVEEHFDERYRASNLRALEAGAELVHESVMTF
jgi:2-oxoglutarate ferredoxin oxidoreductase subunit gamma